MIAQGFVLVWVLIFTGPFGQTVHPIHFPSLISCGRVAIAITQLHPELQSQCEPVSRPVILPRQSPLVTPQVEA